MLVVAVAAALVQADRLGLFGQARVGDFQKYDGKTFRVVHVVDGDTLDVAVRDGILGTPFTRIRLWGVDTPETVRPDTPPQHFGPQASAFVKSAALDANVRLELDPSRTRDKYDRLLAYVYLPDGRMLNSVLVREGCGYADPRFSHKHKAEFKRLQRQAMKARRGLWKDVRRQDLPDYYKKLKLPEAEVPK